ncbi:MAG: shikimate dehydrogenase family protein, partial [Bacillota bacterium]
KVDPRGVEGRRVLMLGAGGSARAVAVTLAMAGAKEINIINRTLSKAQEIMEIVYGLDCRGQALGWDDKSIKEAVQESDFIINTTSLGMVPRVEEMPPLNPDWFRPSQWVIDLIYKPKETLFLREARIKGCQTLNGLGMLLEQGVLAFEQWSGLKPPVEVMARELERWV